MHMVIQRKLLKYGYTTMLSVPKYWIEQQGLQPKDTVEMTITDNGCLLIKPYKERINDAKTAP